MLLALPGFVVAGSTAGATGLLRPGSVAEAEVPKPAFKPKLDLRLGAGRLPLVRDIRPVPSIAPSDTPPVAGQASAERPLTFGFDVRTRHRVGDEVRADLVAPPSLGDEIESAIDRSTFGVTGTYRF